MKSINLQFFIHVVVYAGVMRDFIVRYSNARNLEYSISFTRLISYTDRKMLSALAWVPFSVNQFVSVYMQIIASVSFYTTIYLLRILTLSSASRSSSEFKLLARVCISVSWNAKRSFTPNSCPALLPCSYFSLRISETRRTKVIGFFSSAKFSNMP